MSELRALRDEIDRLDQELLETLARRRAVVARLQAMKAREGRPAYDAAREAEMRQARAQAAQALGVPTSLADAVWNAILEDSRGRQ